MSGRPGVPLSVIPVTNPFFNGLERYGQCEALLRQAADLMGYAQNDQGENLDELIKALADKVRDAGQAAEAEAMAGYAAWCD